MDPGVGGALRQARIRREVDLSEVANVTKIRVAYLQAMENEQWELLPEAPYGYAFLRTYAGYLGLDGAALVRTLRERRGARPEEEVVGGEPAGWARAGPGGERPGRTALLGALAAAVVVALLVGVAVLTLGGGPSGPPERGRGHPEKGAGTAGAGAVEGAGSASGGEAAQRSGHTIRLTATAEVWVCLLDAHGQPLVDGLILEAGDSEGPYRSGNFTVSLGNGEVTMTVDREQANIPATPNPVGYEIGGEALRPLDEAERPTCT
jgi:cytoskeleton protein RodZ